MRLLKKYLLLFFLTLAMSGCMSIAWIGFKKPQSEDYISIGDHSNCMRIAMQNLSPKEKTAVEEAATAVCQIFNSDAFKTELISKKWLASCEDNNGAQDEIDGLAVYNSIMKKINDYSIHSRKPWRAIAQTQRSEVDSRYNRVAIKPKRIEAWYSSYDSIKSELINTIAHETMHIISYDFADSGHGTLNCPDSQLVSYAVGNLVEEIWLRGGTSR